jgi:hypothetical protein
LPTRRISCLPRHSFGAKAGPTAVSSRIAGPAKWSKWIKGTGTSRADRN